MGKKSGGWKSLKEEENERMDNRKISELVVDEWEYEQAGRPREGGTEGCMIWNGWTK